VFSVAELLVLLLVGALLGFAILRLSAKRRRQIVANTQPEAFRSQQQRTLHWLSILCLLPPLGYIFAINDAAFWPVLGVLFANAGIMLCLRLIGVGYVARLWLLPVVTLVSTAVGSAVYAWPSLNAATLQSSPWFLLLVNSLLVSASGALSILSFPVGYGERSK
jgi:hypothetical protein